MIAANLTAVIDRLRRFEADARSLSLSLAPLLRRASVIPNVGAPLHLDAVDAKLPPSVTAPLNRMAMVLADVVAVSGSALFDLHAALSLYPELIEPPLPDVPIAADADVGPVVAQPIAKVARRR
jgi:hypothetical protein